MTRKPYLKEPRYVTALCVWVPDAWSLIDCMRYDNCYPESGAESFKIERLIHRSDDVLHHIIRLVRVSRTELPPTLDRWRSFGAFVLDVRHPEDTPPTNDELANLVKINQEIRQ
jgi:hypothetical protein